MEVDRHNVETDDEPREHVNQNQQGLEQAQDAQAVPAAKEKTYHEHGHDMEVDHNRMLFPCRLHQVLEMGQWLSQRAKMNCPFNLLI